MAENPVDVERGRRYVGAVRRVRAAGGQRSFESMPPHATDGDAWDVLETSAGSLEAPADWAGEHDQ